MSGSGLLLCKLTPRTPFRRPQIPAAILFSVSNSRRSPEPWRRHSDQHLQRFTREPGAKQVSRGSSRVWRPARRASDSNGQADDRAHPSITDTKWAMYQLRERCVDGQ